MGHWRVRERGRREKGKEIARRRRRPDAAGPRTSMATLTLDTARATWALAVGGRLRNLRSPRGSRHGRGGPTHPVSGPPCRRGARTHGAVRVACLGPDVLELVGLAKVRVKRPGAVRIDRRGRANQAARFGHARHKLGADLESVRQLVGVPHVRLRRHDATANQRREFLEVVNLKSSRRQVAVAAAPPPPSHSSAARDGGGTGEMRRPYTC